MGPIRARHRLLSRISLWGAVAAVAISTLDAAPRHAPESSESVRSAYAALPLQFEENLGQTDAAVRYLSRGSGYTVFLTADEVVYSLEKRVYSHGEANLPADVRIDEDLKAMREGRMPEYQRHVIRMSLDGANAAANISAENPFPGSSHYIRGQQGRTGSSTVTAPNFERVRYSAVYPGVDVVYHGKQQAVEYDFVVAPGADPSVIAMQFEGASGLNLTAEGDLTLQVPGGALYHQRPYAYQVLDGEQVQIAADFRLGPDGAVAFELGDYDRQRELIIDPVLLVSTYLGGNTEDRINDIFIDGAGDVYVVGQSNSTDYPVAGVPFGPFLRGETDAFVTKLNSALTTIIQSTYVGGALSEIAFGVAADASGIIYVTGNTRSTDFPTAVPDQATLGGETDMFFFCLSANGSTLINSTYFGGALFETGFDIELLGSTIYVAGDTSSTDLPTTSPVQGALAGPFDLFLVTYTISGAATTRTFASYIGGVGDERGLGMDVDSAGRAYIVGEMTTAGITPVRAFDSTFGGGGNSDGILYGVTVSGTPEINLTTYIGGAGTDILRDIEVFSDGSAVIVGGAANVNGPDPFPIVNADHLQPTYGGGAQDAVIMHLSGVSGSSASPAPVIEFSTFWGGSGQDFAIEVSTGTDSTGPFFVAGSTSSPNFPAVGATQSTLGGAFDAFFLKGAFSPRPFFSISTYAGGGNSDFGRAIAYNDDNGDIFATGFTSAIDFPTLNALPPDFNVHQGSEDGFIQKIQPCTLSLTPPGDLLFDGGPNSGMATVTASDGNCAWDISGDEGITAGQTLPGLGSGTATFDIAANTGEPRTLTVNIAEGSFTITQLKTAATFSDVEKTDFFFDAANLLKIMSISDGCTATEFCPASFITRSQMAVFVVRAIFGGDDFTFSATPVFADVPATHPFFKWIQKLSELGITSGCGPSSYCPGDFITREQAAVFLVRLRFGATFGFSHLTPAEFDDVPDGAAFFSFIQELKEQGGTSGCSASNFCPKDPITRGQMALILVRMGFNMLLPSGIAHIGAIDVPAGAPGAVVAVVLTGVNTSFVGGTTTVEVGQPGITTSGVTVTSPTSLMVTLTISPTADERNYSIIAKTGDEEAVLPLGFTVATP